MEDDYESVPAPDDDDAETFLFTGRISDWLTDEPVSGMDVGIGENLDGTDYEGRYGIESDVGAPQQVDFYTSETSVTTYADCELQHDLSVFSSSARGADEFEVQVFLEGFTDSGTISGSWVRQSGNVVHIQSIGGVSPQQEEEGSWYLTLTTGTTEIWRLALSELDGGVIVWGSATGEVIEEDTVLVVSLSDEGLVAGSWDGSVDPVVSRVTVQQRVSGGSEWPSVYLPILESAPTGQTSPLMLVDTGEQPRLKVSVERSDLEDCSSHRQGFDLFLDSLSDTLRVPELFAVPRLVSTAGEAWTYRPEVEWLDVSDDPNGSTSAYLQVDPPDGGERTRWSIRPDSVCGPETASWPFGLPDIQAESTGRASASYYGADRWASCYVLIEFPAL